MADISVYATLCALATLGRGELKTRVVEGEGLAGEGEGMKELLDFWMASNFRAVLGLLEKSSVSPSRLELETPEPWLNPPGKSGSLSARSSARPTLCEPPHAHPLPRGCPLFPAVRDDTARAHERGVRVDRRSDGEGGGHAHPAGGNPRPGGQPK